MAFWHRFLIPANTLEATPESEFVLLVAGVVQEIEIWFPSGCAGLVHLQVCDRGHQLYPREPGESFVGDDWHIAIKESLDIEGEPYGLTLVGWSPGTTYDHGVYVHFEIVPHVVSIPVPVEVVEIPIFEE